MFLFRKKVKASFLQAREDILALQTQISFLIEKNAADNAALVEEIHRLEGLLGVAPKPAPKLEQVYVASLEGKSYHVSTCLFAQNINPKNKISFSSKSEARKTHKACRCVK